MNFNRELLETYSNDELFEYKNYFFNETRKFSYFTIEDFTEEDRKILLDYNAVCVEMSHRNLI